MPLEPRVWEALGLGAFFGVFFALAVHALECVRKKPCRWNTKAWLREALFAGGFFALGWFLLGFF
jgi:hypothetical protein